MFYSTSFLDGLRYGVRTSNSISGLVPITDHFYRPATREIFIEHSDLLNVPNWVAAFTGTRIDWPGPMSTAVHLDAATNRLVLNEDFETAIRDSDRWIMSPEAFEAFPSLKGKMNMQRQ